MSTPGGGPPWLATTLRGYPLDELVSGFQKAIRRADVDLALYLAVEGNESGYGAYLWRRLLVIASEDIGAADHEAAVVVAALHYNSRVLYEAMKKDRQTGKWPAEPLLQAVNYLSAALKNRECCDAYNTIYGRLNRGELTDLPDYSVDMHTRRGRALGRGEDFFDQQGGKLEPHIEIDGDPWHARYLAERSRDTSE